MLRLYQSPEFLRDRLTTLRLLTRPQREIAEAAERVRPALQAALGSGFDVTVEPMFSQIGSARCRSTSCRAPAVVRTADGKRGGRALAQLERCANGRAR